MKRIALAGAFAFLLGPASAGPYVSPPTTLGLQPSDPLLHGGYPPQGRLHHYPPKVQALLDLRNEGLRLREADGGTLTEEHRVHLQNKLDAIQAEYPTDASQDDK
ncbi:MAG TPA: hypothetical protein VMD53_09305 [Rhizomicrobium sp.]|nr:hypothetical protein [Rhizomicrobium sp.]